MIFANEGLSASSRISFTHPHQASPSHISCTHPHQSAPIRIGVHQAGSGCIERGMPVFIIDETKTPHTGKVIDAFAAEEWLSRRAGTGDGPPLIYIWQHAHAFVLGLRDSKLPHAREVMARMEADGCSTVVRHSGGAAVPLDDGVVNVSLIMPKPKGKLDFHDDFRLLFNLIRGSVERLAPSLPRSVECGEIVGSYCPGNFDMSIGGLKFCGLAQRRQIGAIAVQAFVLVERPGEQRTERAIAFYRDSVGTHRELVPERDYPSVRPGTMASLAELVDATITVPRFVASLKEECRRVFSISGEMERADVPRAELELMAAELEERYQP